LAQTEKMRQGFAGRDTGLIIVAGGLALTASLYRDRLPLLDDPAFWPGWLWALCALLAALFVYGVGKTGLALVRRVPFQERIFRTRQRGPEWGFVYILKNPAMPGLYKVGFTTDHPKTRARALHTTGVAASFQVVWFLHCDHARRVEQQAHRLLQRYRVAKGREFFRAEPAQLIATIKQAAAHVEKVAPAPTKNKTPPARGFAPRAPQDISTR
jgi:hypothetical protein